LEWLKRGLREDPLFPNEALEVLKHVDPMSTHTTATSAESLVEWWLTERELPCYERGRVVSDTTDVTLFPDDTGSYEMPERAIELAWLVDPAEVRTLLFRYDMHTPNFLQRETPSPPYQGGPTELGYTVEEAAIEIEKGWGVPHNAMQDRLHDAVIRGELEVLDPQTGLPYKPTVRRDFYERISTAKLNAWFKLKSVPYQLEGHRTPDVAVAGKQVDSDDSLPGGWKMRVQQEAGAMWKRLRDANCSPTKHNIKGDLAKWCRDNEVKTDRGVFPDEDYIYRHVLRRWTPPGRYANPAN